MQETRLLCSLFPRCSDNEERRKDGTWRKRIGKKRRSFSRCRNFPSAVHKKKVRQVKTPETWTKKIPELKVQYVFWNVQYRGKVANYSSLAALAWLFFLRQSVLLRSTLTRTIILHGLMTVLLFREAAVKSHTHSQKEKHIQRFQQQQQKPNENSSKMVQILHALWILCAETFSI